MQRKSPRPGYSLPSLFHDLDVNATLNPHFTGFNNSGISNQVYTFQSQDSQSFLSTTVFLGFSQMLFEIIGNTQCQNHNGFYQIVGRYEYLNPCMLKFSTQAIRSYDQGIGESRNEKWKQFEIQWESKDFNWLGQKIVGAFVNVNGKINLTQFSLQQLAVPQEQIKTYYKMLDEQQQEEDKISYTPFDHPQIQWNIVYFLEDSQKNINRATLYINKTSQTWHIIGNRDKGDGENTEFDLYYHLVGNWKYNKKTSRINFEAKILAWQFQQLNSIKKEITWKKCNKEWTSENFDFTKDIVTGISAIPCGLIIDFQICSYRKDFSNMIRFKEIVYVWKLNEISQEVRDFQRIPAEILKYQILGIVRKYNNVQFCQMKGNCNENLQGVEFHDYKGKHFAECKQIIKNKQKHLKSNPNVIYFPLLQNISHHLLRKQIDTQSIIVIKCFDLENIDNGEYFKLVERNFQTEFLYLGKKFFYLNFYIQFQITPEGPQKQLTREIFKVINY